MINKKFFEQLKKEYDRSNNERRQIISIANIILHNSKRAIFATQRGDFTKAEELISENEEQILELEKKFGFERLSEEGAYRAGVEEYVEAKLFYQASRRGKIDKVGKLKIDVESYLAGISDLTGELVRLAINQAAAGKVGEVKKIKEMVNEIMSELVEFDFTGYLRTKYDQAKTNLRKIEQIIYEINIRK